MTMTEAETPSTADVLQGMFTENTGTHFLDSGGAYGRNWERNQGKSFEDQPAAWMSISGPYRDEEYSIDITLSAYHFLKDRLEFDPVGQRVMDAIAALSEEPYLADAEAWAELVDGHGIYGDGPWFTVNTYNGEDALSQTLQYVYVTLDEAVSVRLLEDEAPERIDVDPDEYTGPGEIVTIEGGTYIVLQVHGGCDVRGGYTAPKIFQESTYEGIGILDNARVELYCTGDKRVEPDPDQTTLDIEIKRGYEPQHIWSSDNGGYSFYDVDGCGSVDDMNTWVKADEEGNLYLACPLCGSTIQPAAPCAG